MGSSSVSIIQCLESGVILMGKDTNSVTRRLSQLFYGLTWEISPKLWSVSWLHQNHLESLIFFLLYLYLELLLQEG